MKEKERKIITIGRPSIEHLTKAEAKVFYSTLLSCVIEYYKGKERKETTESSDTANDKG